MKKYFNLALIIYLFSACSKNPENTLPASVECINNSKGIANLNQCEYSVGNFPLPYCDIQQKSKYKLDESSKEYLPQYCQQKGSKIKYKDDKGRTNIFTILNKWFNQTSIIITQSICEKDSQKMIGYCYVIDIVFMTLESETPKIRLNIELTTYIEQGSNINERYGDELKIERQDSNNFYLVDFAAILSKRTLSFEAFSNQEFLPSIVLNGKNYMDVLSYDSHYIYPTFKFYYNKRSGLIAYKDKFGTIWTLEE
jgi:hypothetical protein